MAMKPLNLQCPSCSKVFAHMCRISAICYAQAIHLAIRIVKIDFENFTLNEWTTFLTFP